MWKKKVDEGDEHKINGLCFFHLDGQLCLAVCHASGNYIEILTAESGSLLTTVKGRSIIVDIEMSCTTTDIQVLANLGRK